MATKAPECQDSWLASVSQLFKLAKAGAGPLGEIERPGSINPKQVKNYNDSTIGTKNVGHEKTKPGLGTHTGKYAQNRAQSESGLKCQSVVRLSKPGSVNDSCSLALPGL